jgi:hypothetical protein
LLSIEIILLLISFLEFRIEVLPHITNDSCDLGHAEVGMSFFYELIDIHSVEEESTDCLFRRLRRNVKIESV